MTCEQELIETSLFEQFIRCWCARTTEMDQETRNQWAFYWSWHSNNWAETLEYLDPASKTWKQILDSDTWWLWDPTPVSREEAGVDKQIWEAKLDPATAPWKRFEPVCDTFPKTEPNLLDFLQQLTGVLPPPGPGLEKTEAQLEDEKASCVICTQDVGDEKLYNVLRADFLDFLAAQKVLLSSPTFPDAVIQFQKSKGGRVEQRGAGDGIKTATFDAAQPQTALYIRELVDRTGLNPNIVKHFALLFLSNPEQLSLSRGPVVRTVCQHGFHDACIYDWYLSQRGVTEFPTLQNVRVAESALPLKGVRPKLGAFSCPMCRKQVTSVSVPGLADGGVALGQGEYNLQKGALVWVYDGRRPGGEFAGYLAVLEDFKADSPDQSCSFGGCFVVRPLLPRGDGLSRDVPVPTVFDLSFLEFDILPTRNQVSEAFTPTLEQNLNFFRNHPFFTTEDIGYPDLLQHSRVRDPDVKAALQKQFDDLSSSFSDRRFTEEEFPALLEQHRRNTQSPLVNLRLGGDCVRLTATEMLEKIALYTGYYTSDPPVNIVLTKQLDTQPFIVALLDLVKRQPGLWSLRIHPVMIRLFIAYASGGHDILPSHSAVLLPALRSRYKSLPERIVPLPAHRRTPLYRRQIPSSASSSSGPEPPPLPPPAPKKRYQRSGNEEQKQPKRPKKSKREVIDLDEDVEMAEAKGLPVGFSPMFQKNLGYIMSQTGFVNRSVNDHLRALLILEGWLASRGINLSRDDVYVLPADRRNDLMGRIIDTLLTFGNP